MRLALVYDKSLNSRHEQGYVASLELQSINTFTILLDNTTVRASFHEKSVEVNGRVAKLPILRLPVTNAFELTSSLSKLLEDLGVEAIITLPRRPYLLAHEVSRKCKVPLLIRFWSIRALKLIDNLKHGAYEDLLLSAPSLATNLIEGFTSDGIIVVDDVMYRMLKRLKVNRVRPLVKTYPPAGFQLTGKVDEDLVDTVLSLKPYLIGVTILSKAGSYLKFEAKPHAILFYYLARKVPDVNFLVAGSTREEFIRVFPSLSEKMPQNLIFIGRGFTDDTLKVLYKHSVAAITYIGNRSISNRLLEAIALNTITITNSIALSLHPELKDAIIAANNLDKYLKAIRGLIKNEGVYEEFKERIRNTYTKYFSPKLNAISTLKMVHLARG